MSLRLPDLSGRISRRGVLIGGGAGLGLIVAWAAWPRRYDPNLVAAPGETVLNGWVKIGEDGHVTIVVPQAETGQGVMTTLPQIVADELGADWRTIAVEPAPINPIYANRLFARELAGAVAPSAIDMAADFATREAMMVTAGSTSLRGFEPVLREAGATARALLSMAAAKRWGIDWRTCDTQGGFVVAEERRLRFGEIAAEAAGFKPPAKPQYREDDEEGRLSGQSPLRLDLPGKIDGTAMFASDIRLPGMVFAAIRQGPIGDSRLVGANKDAARAIWGVTSIVENERWLAAVGVNWWAANRALDAMAPRFETKGGLVDDARIDAALLAALDGKGHRLAKRGDLSAVFKGQAIRVADYQAAPGYHAAPEPLTATARWDRDILELWLPTQAPGLARRAAAEAINVSESQVVVHPTLVAGGFGRVIENDAAAQAAIIARSIDKPVQLVWSRVEDLIHDRFRAPARAHMAAKLGPAGRVEGWQAKIASPAWGTALADRLVGGGLAGLGMDLAERGDGLAASGAMPLYAIPTLAIDHHPADVGVPTGYWRSAGDFTSAFFTESFVDELAQAAGMDGFSFRMAMLSGQPRLARCLTTVTALGGWQGGAAGSGQGIACHGSRGSYVAVMAEARIEGDRIAVDRLFAVADVGRAVNPDIVKQQIEGGLIFGLAGAIGGGARIEGGMTVERRLGELGLPRLADSPEINVELLRSTAAPGGASEVAVPPVAPAIANALFAATGRRFRSLPLKVG